MKRTFYFAAILLVAFSIVTGACAMNGKPETPQPIIVSVAPPLGIVASDVLGQVNAIRIATSTVPLIQNANLQTAAQAKAEAMAKGGWFAHISPSGDRVWTSIEATGYAYSELGENLAEGFDDTTSTVAAWVNSPTHYKNIVDKDFRDTGIGIAVGSFDGKPNVIYVVQLFGLQREKAVVQTTVRRVRVLRRP